MEERRRQQRTPVIETAYIAGDGSSMRCHVVNLSDHGAAIEMPDRLYVRPRFKLMLERDRIIRDCRVIWSSGNRIGVEFVD
ncbi:MULTISPECIES: PilZ domain-containing protein [unclassified Bradyrhizobium]|uniref:PilZ domain-containing protein n=1 Tax=unclassified Bradyrhizobium TaxID=2631580 RepID=UPI0024791DE4|nr:MULTISPECIES: PilZ domain-containing protein [unclassified Bradyrhizobium]WGR69829.1 PilZ domain-containing protein [Bradyrhizobium sp. ISRA426]WGR81885.1 PilZ domain-containing protein [Bradyrhizobium sp. ISRA430]WGR85071.1 PilZ domain-containing protein [Bradyrhizobium sp. ISRA432]